jgi:hypothetical protein
MHLIVMVCLNERTPRNWYSAKNKMNLHTILYLDVEYVRITILISSLCGRKI